MGLLYLGGRWLEVGPRILGLRDWIESLGIWAPLACIVIYILGSLAMVPATVLTGLGAAALGMVEGLIAVSLGMALGAAACFLLARHGIRAPLKRRMERNRHFRRLEELTDRHGHLMVFWSRAVGLLPWNLLNYAFGLTPIRFGQFVFWTWLGMLPWTVAFVIGIDALAVLLIRGRAPEGLLAGLLTACVIALGVSILARAQLRRRMRRRTFHHEPPPRPSNPYSRGIS